MNKKIVGGDFSEYDMALELAEWEYLNLSVHALLDKARKQLDREWIKLAQEHPQTVVDAYTNLTGEQDNAM